VDRPFATTPEPEWREKSGLDADQSGSKRIKGMEQKPWFLSVFIRFDPRQMLSPDGRFTRAAAPVRA
jgi:hypothetical protein